jgi:AraC family transcriptional regulator, regulatory protein of adaptative response / methylated-DNA-[protein]-cysteine methyltransferase
LPATAQDVGAACVANVLAVVIPCHQVKADGSISGYRWGVKRKRELINREAVACDSWRLKSRFVHHGISSEQA